MIDLYDLRTWKVVDRLGNTTFISKYTESEAYQEACAFCGDIGLAEFYEV